MIEKEDVIKTGPQYAGNPQANRSKKRINQVLGNLVRTYSPHETYRYDTDQYMGILAAADFTVHSTYHQTKGKSLVQLVFVQDTILPINHTADWKYIR